MLPEYGYLNEYKNGKMTRYVFAEAPEKIANFVINAGEYSCTQTEGLHI